MPLNRGRVWLGGLVGGVVWAIWSFLVGHFVIQDWRYVAAQNAGVFLKTPRYPFFVAQWIVLLFILAAVVAHVYAWTRQTLGPGPKTALRRFLARLFSGVPGELCAGYVVCGRPGIALRLDAGNVDRGNSGCAGSGRVVQRVGIVMSDENGRRASKFKNRRPRRHFACSTNTAVP